MANTKNKWSQPDAPPPPLFLGEKERDLVKQVNDELIERVIGQQILYYPIDLEHTNFHPLYNEAIVKSFLPPVRVYALVEFGGLETQTDVFGIDKMTIVSLKEPTELFGQAGKRVEISADCIVAREGLFDAT
jgi:hypothetical protein